MDITLNMFCSDVYFESRDTRIFYAQHTDDNGYTYLRLSDTRPRMVVVGLALKIAAQYVAERVIAALGNLFVMIREHSWTPLRNRLDYTADYDALDDAINERSSAGLVVIFHGLRSKGPQKNWLPYAQQIRQEHHNFHVCLPPVPAEGNCGVEEASKAFIAQINEYARKHPGAPITLIGTSNGGRIVQKIESSLDLDAVGQRSLNFISVVGAQGGTHLVPRTGRIHGDRLLGLHQDFVQEVNPQNDFIGEQYQLNQQRQREWEECGADVGHLYIGSSEDYVIQGQRFFPLFDRSRYVVIPGETHFSIVRSGRERAVAWLNQRLKDGTI